MPRAPVGKCLAEWQPQRDVTMVRGGSANRPRGRQATESESIALTSNLLKRLQRAELPDENSLYEHVRDASASQPNPTGIPSHAAHHPESQSQPDIRQLAYSLDSNSLSTGETQPNFRQESSVEVRDNLVDRRWVPQMRSKSSSTSQDAANDALLTLPEEDLSFSDVVCAPHSTARHLPKQALDQRRPILPSHPAEQPKQSDVVIRQPPLKKRRLATKAKWHSDEEESADEDEEIEDESMHVAGPPSSQPRNQIRLTQESETATMATVTPEVAGQHETASVARRTGSIDFDGGDDAGRGVYVCTNGPLVVTRHAQDWQPVLRLAALTRPAVGPSRALSRASQEDDDEPTQVTASAVPASVVSPQVQPSSTSVIPESTESRIPSSADSHVDALASGSHVRQHRAGAAATQVPMGETNYEDLPHEASRRSASIIQTSADTAHRSRTKVSAAGPKKVPSSKVATTLSRRRSFPPGHHRDYGNGSDSDNEPEVIRTASRRPAVHVRANGVTSKPPVASVKDETTVGRSGSLGKRLLLATSGRANRTTKNGLISKKASANEDLSRTLDIGLVHNYVLALYRGGSKYFYPCRVLEALPNGLRVAAEDGSSFRVLYEDVRRCVVKPGDTIEYWGNDGNEASELKEVHRIEDHATDEDVEDGSTVSPEDIVVCIEGKGKSKAYSRYMVAAICYPSGCKGLAAQLDDRKLTEEEIRSFKTSSRKSSLAPSRAAPDAAPSIQCRPHSPALRIPLDLFAGLGVLLTQGDRSGQTSPGRPRTPEINTRPAGGIDRSHITRHLEAGGAHVLDDINNLFRVICDDDEDEPVGEFIPSHAVRSLTQIYLIAPAPCTTPKYLAALALGVPCLSQLWVTRCIEASALVDWHPFLLSSAPHVGIGVQHRLFQLSCFSVKALEHRRLQTALLKGESVHCIAAGSDSKYADGLRVLILALGAKQVHVTQPPARAIPIQQVTRASLIVVEDERSDLTNLHHSRLLSVDALKECVYTGTLAL